MSDVQVQNLTVTDGLKNIYYALMTKDDLEGATYGTPKKLGHARRAEISKEVEITTVYGDNKAVATRTRLKQMGLTIETTDIPLEDRATLLGNSVDSTTGAITTGSDDNAPYVAILFEATKFTGGSIFYKLYKGKFTESDETFNTEEESTEPVAPSITGTFIAREFDGKISIKADSTNSNSESITNSWFEAV